MKKKPEDVTASRSEAQRPSSAVDMPKRRGRFVWTSTAYAKNIYPILILTFMLVPLFLSNLDDIQNYHGDENVWIFVGNKVFQLYAIEHDFSNPFWHIDLSSWGSYQPQVAKYIIGLGTYSAGYRDIPLIWYEYTKSNQENIVNGRVLDSHVVSAARTPIAIMGIMSCILTYIITTKVTNRWYGVITTIMLVGSGLLLKYSHRAMVDVPALCFGLAVLSLLIYSMHYIRVKYTKAALILSVATGISLGLALGSKMNTLLIAGVVFVIFAIEIIYAVAKKQNVLLYLACGFLIAGCALTVFILSNPFLYTDTVHGIQHILSMNQFLLNQEHPWRRRTLSAKVLSLYRQTMNFSPFNQLGFPIDGYFILLGVLRLCVTIIRRPRESRESSLAIIALWTFISFVGITLWLPSEYDHYFLPLHPIKAFLQAYGLIWIFEGCIFAIRKRVVVIYN